ncbi:hypothetical protein [Labrenzia sp. R5_0]|jgi:hypothetical protein|uniref:hypothetical protein n=1 Tax=Labrenzia sp. R5_0 TaxID=2821108 RepID=UPI001ADA82A1|nr:hypothetical protein [Labrenzia sp. R5_0]MBO9458963.1 hypothetical protein [Labrenzia sp. R5_0]
MRDAIDWLHNHISGRVVVIAAFALVGASLPKDLTTRQRAQAFFVGALAALVFGEPVREFVGFSETWAYGLAGIIAMTGRNIAVYILRASKDPAETFRDFMDIWRGPRQK